MVGDSFVMGAGVPKEGTIPNLLEAIFGAKTGKTIEVFNFGIGGAISTPEYKILLEKALRLGISAKTVLVAIFIGNDFNPRNFAIRRSSPIKLEFFRIRLIDFVKKRVSESSRLTGFFFCARASDKIDRTVSH